MTSNKRLFLLDASSYLFRAFYAIAPLSNSKKIPTNATYGFTQMILRLLKDEQPTHFVAFFDRPEPSFRLSFYSEYKANRQKMPEDLAIQIPWIKKVLEAMQIPVLEKAGWEADDLIATFSRKMEQDASITQIAIVTGDKDLAQLVSDKVILLDTMKNRWMDIKGVKEKFGIEPEQVVDFLGLAGDSVDNIPGIPGVGEKTATGLLQQFKTLEEIYENLDQLPPKKKALFEQHREQAFLSKKLAQLNDQAPMEYQLEQLKFHPLDSEKLSPLFQELEFRRLAEQFSPLNKESSFVAETKNRRGVYETITNVESLNKLIETIQQKKKVAIDTETTGLNPLKAKLVGISFSVEEEKGFYLPLRHEENSEQINFETAISLIRPILENPEIQKIAQNFKYDYQVLKKAGITVQGIYVDTMLAHYLLYPSESHNLDGLALSYFQHQMISYEEVTDGKKEKTFAEVSIQRATEYSGEDADFTFRLHNKMMQELESEKLVPLFSTIELPLIPILAEIEEAGIKIDRPFLTQLQQEFSERIKILEQETQTIAGEVFNLNSPKQLAEILFNKLNLPIIKKTKTGPSTDVEVLTELANQHPLPRSILNYRSLMKLKSTYVDALLESGDEKDRVHTSFNQTIAETGRLSSSNPNLQNIPIRSEEGKKIRQAFIAEEGFQLLSADYSQIELRILAHLSEDPALIEAFENDHDIHRKTASILFKIPEESVSSNQRSVGKTVNFGVVYGQSAFSLSKQLGIPLKEAQQHIQSYFEKYKNVQKFREKILREAEEKEKVHTLFGRQRQVPEIKSKNGMIRSNGERIAFNTVIQGTAADIIKVAMIHLHEKMKKIQTLSRLLLQVHDELVFEISNSEKEKVSSLIQYEMENVCQMKIPLKVEIGIGKNWGEVH